MVNAYGQCEPGLKAGLTSNNCQLLVCLWQLSSVPLIPLRAGVLAGRVCVCITMATTDVNRGQDGTFLRL